MNTVCMYLFKLVFLVFLDIQPGMEFLSHMVVFIFCFFRNLHTVFTVAVQIYIPTNGVQGLPFFHILSNICYFCSFLMTAILTGVRWYLIVVLICIADN